MKKIVCLVCLLLLSACSLSPDVEPKAAATPPATPTAVPTMTPTPLPSTAIIPSPEVDVTVAPTAASTEADLIRQRPLPPTPTATRIPLLPLLSRPRPPGRETHVPVLMFHHIAIPPARADAIRYDLSVWPEQFEAMLAAFKSMGYYTVKLEDVYNAVNKGVKLPGKPIVLTFDDGYDDNYTNALPLLKKYNFTGTFYIPSGLVEQKGYMTWAQVVELSEAGMDIQSHTVSHPDLKDQPEEFVRYELEQSKRSLEMMIGKPVKFFCYPSGRYDSLTIQLLQETGYLSATTTWAGSWQNAGQPYEWPRVRIHGGQPAAKVLEKMREFVGAPY